MAIEKISIEIKSNAKEIEQELSSIDSQIKKLNSTKIKLQSDTQQLNDADKTIDNLNQEIKNLNSRKATLQVEQAEVVQTETALEKLKSKLTQIGSTTTNVNLSSNISSIGSQLDSMGSKLLSMLNPLKSQLSQWIGIGAAVKVVNSAISLISSSVSGAISRYDTLNNFPKIMANFKISTEDATAAINKLNDGLDGLPTEIDTATTAVQRFVTKNNDINKSTDYFLALNNALIAGATDASTQSSALEQLLQAYSKGTLDMVEWRSLLTAMPGQLNQVAIAMGYTSDALGEGLRDGSISMDDFMDTIARLNTEGVDGFASFEEQALAAIDGVEVGLTRMKTAVKRGVTSVIESLDTLLKNAGLGGLVGTLSTIGSAFETGLKRVGEIITENEAVITNFINKVRSFDWASVWAGFKESVTEIKESARSFLDTMEPVIDFVKDRITALGDGNFAKGLGKLPALLIKVGVGAKLLGGALKILGKFTDFKLPSIFGGKDSKGSTGLTFNFDAGKMLNQVKNMALVFAAIKIIQQAAQALKDINDKVPEDLSALAPKLANMGIALVSMGALVAVAGKLAEKNPVAAVAGLASIALISLNLMLAAEAIQQINDKVPDEIADFAKKIANMAIAIGAMGALVAAAGLLAAANPVAAIAGLAAVALISLDLMLAAEAIKQVDEKVPDGIADFAKKMANIAIAIGGFGVLAAAVGAVMATGIGALVGAAGLLAIAAVAADMLLVAETIAEVDKKVPDDISSVKTKIENIAEAIGYFTAANLGTAVEAFENAVGLINVAVVSAGMGKMVDLVEQMKLFNEVEIPEGINQKIKDIQEVLGYIDGASLQELIENTIGMVDLAVLDQSLKQLIDIGNKLGQFKDIDFDSGEVEEKVKQIKKAVELLGDEGGLFSKLKKLVEDSIDSATLEAASEAFTNLVKIGRNLELLQGIEFEFADIEEKVKGLKKIIKMIGDTSLMELLGTLGDLANLKLVSTAIDTLKTIGNKLNELAELTVDFAGATTKVTETKSFIEELSKLPDATGLEALESLVQSFKDLLAEINTVAEQMIPAGTAYGTGLLEGFNSADVPSNMIKVIETAITKLNEKKAKFTEIGKAFGSNLRKAFESEVKNLHKAIDSQLTSLKGYNASFTTLGTNYGNYLVNSFNTAISKLSASVSSQVKSMQTSLNSLSVPTLTVSTGSSTQSMLLSTGGEVPQYLASGGISGMFKKKGTDTVPAMLTPGEFVQNKKAVSAFGLDFMNRVNNLDIKGAFNALTGRFSTYTMATPIMSSVVNNADNRVNNAKVTQNITSGSQNYSLRRANRFVKSL